MAAHALLYCFFFENLDNRFCKKTTYQLRNNTWISCKSYLSSKQSGHILRTGRRLGDRFREHLRDVEKDDKDASKPIARHFNLHNHSMQHMAVCGVSPHQGNTKSRKTLEQKFIFKSALLILTVLTNAFHSTILFSCFSRYQAPTNSVAPNFCI